MPKRKRDPIGEIIGKRQRLGRRGSVYAIAEDRAFALIIAMIGVRALSVKAERANRHVKREMLRYLPIGLVSCLEGYFRVVIRDLIDSGHPYRERVSRLEDLRLDIGTVLRMQEAKVTVGEFVSHLLPLSSLDDINRHLSVLMDLDYFESIKKCESPRSLTREAFAEAIPHAWETLTSVFDDRHIACHELRVSWRRLTYKRAAKQWRAVLFLLDADEWLRRDRGLPDAK